MVGKPTPTGTDCPFLPRAHPGIEGKVVPYHANAGEDVRTIANEASAFDRTRELAIFDEIGFTRRKTNLPLVIST